MKGTHRLCHRVLGLSLLRSLARWHWPLIRLLCTARFARALLRTFVRSIARHSEENENESTCSMSNAHPFARTADSFARCELLASSSARRCAHSFARSQTRPGAHWKEIHVFELNATILPSFNEMVPQ